MTVHTFVNFHSIVTFAALAILGWIVYDVVASYKASKSTGVQRWIDAAKGSATLLVAQVGLVCSAIGVALGGVLNWIGAITGDTSTTDAIKNAISSHFSVEGAALILAGFMVVVAIARFRTLGKNL